MENLDKANLELEFLRKQIDKLDSKLVEILAKRKNITTKVGKLKAKNNFPAVDPNRENKQFNNLKQKAINLGVDPNLASDILKLIIESTVKSHNLIKDKYDKTIK
jgi:monofunctional chorismate mutase